MKKLSLVFLILVFPFFLKGQEYTTFYSDDDISAQIRKRGYKDNEGAYPLQLYIKNKTQYPVRVEGYLEILFTGSKSKKQYYDDLTFDCTIDAHSEKSPHWYYSRPSDERHGGTEDVIGFYIDKITVKRPQQNAPQQSYPSQQSYQNRSINAVSKTEKYAFVNTQSIMEVLPEIKTANEQLEQVKAKYQEEFTKLQLEFQKKSEEFQSLDASTPQSIKDHRVQEMQEFENKINQFSETANQDLARQQQQLLAPIQEKIMKAIQSIGTGGGYSLVFDSVVPIFIGTGVRDITEEVKNHLGVK